MLIVYITYCRKITFIMVYPDKCNLVCVVFMALSVPLSLQIQQLEYQLQSCQQRMDTIHSSLHHGDTSEEDRCVPWLVSFPDPISATLHLGLVNCQYHFGESVLEC